MELSRLNEHASESALGTSNGGSEQLTGGGLIHTFRVTEDPRLKDVHQQAMGRARDLLSKLNRVETTKSTN